MGERKTGGRRFIGLRVATHEQKHGLNLRKPHLEQTIFGQRKNQEIKYKQILKLITRNWRKKNNVVLQKKCNF